MLLNTNMQHQFPSEEPRKNATLGISAAVGVNVLTAPLTANISTLITTHHLLHVTQARSPEASHLTAAAAVTCLEPVTQRARVEGRPTRWTLERGSFLKTSAVSPMHPDMMRYPTWTGIWKATFLARLVDLRVQSLWHRTINISTAVTLHHQHPYCYSIAPQISVLLWHRTTNIPTAIALHHQYLYFVASYHQYFYCYVIEPITYLLL